jgi:CRISPR-associated endonuclease/helicase Cas3
MWANLKRDDSGNVTAWHSLVDHSADVAAVLLALLEQPTFAERLAILSGGDRLSPIARARLGALAFLHDIGKANRGFRARIDTRAPLVGHIDPLGWLFGAEGGPLLSQLQAVLGLERFDCWFADGDWSPFETAFAPHGRPWNRRAANARAYWRPYVAAATGGIWVVLFH